MFGYEVISHLIPSLIFLILVSIFKIGTFHLVDFLSLWAGGLIGTFFLDIDHFIYTFFFRPELPWSQEARELFNKKDYKGSFMSILNNHLKQTELIFHNAIFLPILAALSFFVLTSSGSLFASGFVLMMYLHLLKDTWDMIRLKKSYQLDWFFWQINAPLNEAVKKYFVWGASLIFLLESWFIFR